MKKIFFLGLILIAAVLPAFFVSAEEEQASEVGEMTAPADGVKRPRVEVVFVLDTTGSMSGLIQAAKEKIWAIANTLSTTEPVPEIRMGLVGYRDRGDDYITKRTDLTDDIDLVYAELMGYQAGGGGDHPESVNQALNEAVMLLSWSNDPNTYRVIFLVGDAPPHMDYQEDVKYPESCRIAVEKGIIVNTIQCGSHGDTTPIWREIALLSEGQYFQVEQSGNAMLAGTPYDATLAELSRRFDGTYLAYGSREVQEVENARMRSVARAFESSTESALARRAAFKVGESAPAGRLDLVDGVKDGSVAIDSLSVAELPEELQAMSPEERDAYVQEKAKEREDLRAQIQELTAQRQTYLEDQVRSMGTRAEGTLDAAVYGSIQSQAAERGIIYDRGPSY